MDPSAPKTISKGVAITSVLCGTTAGLYCAFKGQHPAKLALFSSVNSCIAATMFFSVREYAVGPALTLIHPGRQYQLRRRHLKNIQDGSSSEQRGLSWYDLRTSYLLDSALSGAISGGFLYTWKRGRPGVVPGLATGALMCTMLQWCVNELNILRIEYVAGKVAIPVPVANYTSETESPHKAAYSLQPSLQPETKSWHDRFFSLFGRRVSDEEYLKRLKAERDSHLLRIEQLEKELHDRPAS